MDCSTIRSITNARIYERNLPSQPLQQYISFRSVPTKYSIMPIVDPHTDPTSVTPIIEYPTFNQNNQFTPGNTTAPWSGYASNVNTESVLRDQIYAANRCSTTTYIPNSSSDLYINNVAKPSSEQPLAEFPYLSAEEKWRPSNPGQGIPQTMLFGNCTRQQRNHFTLS